MLSVRKSSGFSLVELMVALVVGLVISFAVISFIASIINSSNSTIQATRVNQELRSLAEVVVRELRRARSISDPLSNIGRGASATSALNTVDISTAGCALFGYQGAVGGDYRSIRRAVVGGIGTVVVSGGAAAQTCASAGTTISSTIVDITDLTFTAVGTDRIDIVLQGRLAGDAGSAVREFRTSVFVRSGRV